MKKSIICLVLLFHLTVLLFVACRKNDSDDVIPNVQQTSEQIRTTISGYVLNEMGQALSGVTVSTNGYIATTNDKGIFLLSKVIVDKNRCVISFSKSGFTKRNYVFRPTDSSGQYVKLMLLNNVPNKTVSGVNGGTVSLPNGATIEFQPNSFTTANGTAYTGTVNIYLKHLSPDDTDFSMMMPGGDMLAKDTTGKIVSLYSFGMMMAELTSTNNLPLQLAAGKPATISMPIAPSQILKAPATIPLWYFDETTSLWIEEGGAAKVGSAYTGQVKHFSFWNCDFPGERATIKGRIIDCNGNPMPNVVVTLDNWFDMLTDNNGVYQSWVPANISYVLQVLLSHNSGVFSSAPVNITPIAPGQTYTVPDISLPCPSSITGTLQNCAGVNVAGYVAVLNLNANLLNLIYTGSGQFSINVPSQIPIVIYVSSLNNFEHYDTLNAISNMGTIINLGSIQLCTYANDTTNLITINGAGFNNQTFIFTNALFMTSDLPSDTSIYSHELELGGILQPYGSCYYYGISLKDTLAGTQPIINSTQVDFQLQTPQVDYAINLLPGGIIELHSNALIPGDYFEGTYSGQADIINLNTVTSTQGTVIGKFRVRKQF
ncbi:MAG TPA: hypothetical protein PLU85_09280 [Bacteroidia bacterium]|mgnify:CR=1 FL=1|nr:hypothetical protein [Bacteroidia bacterium]QQR94245.1 MAG: hypothetical protein IPJ93_10170 [Bacteroidota bacterium]MBP7714532.1 hypothetical protein [Bacteroidia bacterium]MBP8669016.1 hypothetical protein [Bacteroidia bacterium]HOZ82642.1 hypothetical protein [Bacteroidia bacterium]